MYQSKILLLVFIFLTVWMGSINFVKFVRKSAIPPWNFILFASGIVGIIAYFL